MIIVMQPEAGDAEIAAVEARIRAAGLEVHVSRGTERTLIGAIGDERKLDPEMFDPLPGVERSMHILKPYKLVAREWHKASTIVDVAGVKIGANAVQVIAGPCSVESEPQIVQPGQDSLKAKGATGSLAGRRLQAQDQSLQLSRDQGGRPQDAGAPPARKPGWRSSPRSWPPGARLERRLRCTPMSSRSAPEHAELPAPPGRGADRGETRRLLKRGMSETIDEFLLAAEYILDRGNPHVMLCERGIRTSRTRRPGTSSTSARWRCSRTSTACRSSSIRRTRVARRGWCRHCRARQ